ncbi:MULTISPECIES: HlyD family secretion protein [Bradyrhizobium]|uniref:Multidrug resistance efflux pump n=2 Tax=Bradyrhizobium ottawaense TaxID=931866 RepID=A0ABV4FLY1_9BRAD|nr:MULTISPECIES: HlyD family secretion protein [Bradyrhizobium]MBR1295023.1 HlyD family secretion protein [Bradyrhizobium ottawaense]MDA9486397.1 multidrug transporter [Bradyrhizobium sp. CCBAU 11445]WLB44702.1 HlyD family secretion protein [Bradyrhizobium ottawaense]BBO03387.1 MFP transporter [Bradyrhizobium ottawaense]GMO10595.1 HlyD family secretion protein [Bradyrhizobium ottawaense]
MVIVLCLYIVVLWSVFSKFRLVKWGWLSGTISLLVGGFILATFLALFNYLTPSGRVTVTGRVVEVTPNVTGQIVAIPVKPNVPVKKDDLLFQIDSAPFQYKVMQLQASLAAAKQQTEILKSNYEQATANVTGLTAQVAYNRKRLADIQTLASDDANSQFQAQDKQVQYETVSAQLGSAKAAQQSAKLALDSEIGGVNTSVAQLQAQLDNATWELSQTAVRAPADGYVTVLALSVGDRALQARSAMSFIVESEITLVGMFSQNGFQAIKEGAPVDIVFDNVPGRIYHAKIIAIPRGVGQGQIAVSGTLARTNTIGGATVYPAVISIPDGMSRDSLRLGMSGSATAFADNAGVIGMLASILVWIGSYTAYL